MGGVKKNFGSLRSQNCPPTFKTRGAALDWLGPQSSALNSVLAARCYVRARPMPSCGVCPSITFLYSVEMNKYIFRIFSPSGSPTIIVFPYQTLWQYSDGERRMHGAPAGYAILGKYMASSRVVNAPSTKRYTHSCAGVRTVVSL